MYRKFLEAKSVADIYGGFDADLVNSNLFDFQEAIVRWALKKGRCAIFADTGVWMDIRSSRTLNYRGGRDDEDERHICPMALDIIERGIELWSNPGDIVFDPFSGIGSTAHCAIKAGRRFAGSELKSSYFKMAANNLDELFNRKLFLNLQTFAVIECHDGSIVANDQFQDVTGDPIWEACA